MAPTDFGAKRKPKPLHTHRATGARREFAGDGTRFIAGLVFAPVSRIA